MSARSLPQLPARRRRVHWTTIDAVEQLAFDTGAEIEAGIDDKGEYAAVVTAEGVEYRGRLGASS
ncbi:MULTISPECIES: hypothetical protein [unclassified Nocardioides]|uniref:hypothetical protein n=1 Tax=unclassified Nocardioides TaxID=2615069 RepID=UPI0009F01270|nr:MULTISPECIES: hypothetical protein [unclassified Nocardioides]GAW50576.1 uncharacterized protein PD653B2_2912 [Nocardioides sp. PD653-B2]GAW56699.1 uncharacterized protein PD653_4137 [Nocardioides sp. PD653]